MLHDKKEKLYKSLTSVLSGERVYRDEPLSRRTTFRIGGPAAFFVDCGNVEELRSVLEICKNEDVKWYILGNGSNVLAGDEGYDGVIIKLTDEFSKLCYVDEINEGTGLITAGAGAMLTQVSIYALKRGFTGLEFAHGIPGTVGGAVYMNAGAYGGEIKQIIVDAKVLTESGDIVTYTKDELDLSYRHSRFSNTKDIILEASFRLTVYPRILIRAVMENYKKARMTKQPLELPSAGSTFKRPEGAYAGALIQQAGLKGFSVGGACVSEKHAGFVVNKGGATCADVLALVEHIQKKVKETSGFELETEIKLLK